VAQLGAEGSEIAVVAEAEIVSAAGIMAGKIGELQPRSGGTGASPGRWPA